MDEHNAVQALAALAHPIRLRVFRALVEAGEAGMTPGIIAADLGIPANTLSFHLKDLAQAGLVSAERASRNLIYRARFACMAELLGYLTDNCCQGQPCAAAIPLASCLERA